MTDRQLLISIVLASAFSMLTGCSSVSADNSAISAPPDISTVKRWSAEFRGWHYYPDHVIPARPNIKGFEDVKMTDVPTVFQLPGGDKWYMTFIGFDGRGYQSFIAESDDLINWTNMRLAMGYGPKGSFDHGGVVLGAFHYADYDIKAPRILKRHKGKYFSLYGAYPRQGGYELRPGSQGVAISQDGLKWKRAKDEPILSVYQPDCGAWETDCIYMPWLTEHKGRYYNHYNAANGGTEQMGLAVSDDLLNWKRYEHNPVIPNGPKGSFNEVFSSDGKIYWDTNHWVMFFFGVGRGGAHIMTAFSRDLRRWTVDPEPLYKSGGNPSGLDKKYAHKISLIYNPKNQTYYMFYNAVGDKGRGIGLITSKPIKSPKQNNIVTPSSSRSQKWDSVYLQNDFIKLHLVPECGGRVMQYSLAGHDFFWNNDKLINVKPPPSGLGPNGQWLNYGGEKLWPAPQGWDNDKQWPGPPDAVLDGGPYTIEQVEDKDALKAVRLTSRKDKRTGIQFSRIIKCFEGTSRVSIDVTMKNINPEPIRWGIWSHAQFDASGRGGDYNKDFRAYCPLNPDSKFHRGYTVQFGLVNNPTFKPDYENNMMRLHYQRIVGKAGVDCSAGWVATVNGETGHVFVQRFTYEPQKAYPDNSSVEFWSHGPGDFFAWGKLNSLPEDPNETPYFFESEILSPYAHLKPAEQYTYHYEWFAARVPKAAEVVSCNDIGIVCEKLTASVKDRRLSISGRFGVFYQGDLVPVLYDSAGNKALLTDAKVKVSPLKSIDISSVNKALKNVKLPPKAREIELLIYDADGKAVGKLTEARIRP
ncbi:MAG: DUF4380 domain-containing protein [Planctomycetes bacterium]|nr:DUF4380 domain-containing protein [Planctomycetota bacterium]